MHEIFPIHLLYTNKIVPTSDREKVKPKHKRFKLTKQKVYFQRSFLIALVELDVFEVFAPDVQAWCWR